MDDQKRRLSTEPFTHSSKPDHFDSILQHHRARNARANRVRRKNVNGVADHEAERTIHLDSRLGKRETIAAIAFEW